MGVAFQWDSYNYRIGITSSSSSSFIFQETNTTKEVHKAIWQV